MDSPLEIDTENKQQIQLKLKYTHRMKEPKERPCQQREN